MEIYNKQKGAASPGAFAGEPRAFHALPSALRRVPTSDARQRNSPRAAGQAAVSQPGPGVSPRTLRRWDPDAKR